MTDERVVEEIVSKFLLSSCRLRPQLILTPVMAATLGPVMTSRHFTVDDAENDVVPLITGSVAEFYIEPMIPHIGDIDVMFHLSTQLAIPRGHPPPTQLPDQFHNSIKVYEIIDSDLPGYVYLELRYLLTECADGDSAEQVGREYLANHTGIDLYTGQEFSTHGPAFVVTQLSKLPVDVVLCLRCLVWPPQAADWPTRHRDYDWPDSATVDRVVSNGCDVVGKAHGSCTEDGWERKHQWRLSFSRAEIVLINSWMPVQQIVYHMLRFFMKTETERLTESADNSEAGTLSNYHIKTLMLWACELKPRNWWTDDLSLVGICVELLHELAAWLTEGRCPHYFISNCNLVDNSFDLKTISSRLLSINNSCLSSMFIDNYIRRCSHFCPGNVSRLFDDVSTRAKLQNAVSAIVDWRQRVVSKASIKLFIGSQLLNTYMVSDSLTTRSASYWLTESTKISSSLSLYFSSFAFLHVALRISRTGLNDELRDVLSVLVGQSIGPRRYSSRRSSVLLLNKAVNLMKAVDDRSKSRSTVQLIEIELSKAYLYRALTWRNSDSDSMYCLANVYLAVLYYSTGQYQTAIDHCTLVIRSQDHSQCSSHVVRGEILPETDDDIDIVLGLAVFYQHVRITALNQQQQSQYVTVFTTELFAHYLHIKCLSATKCQQLSDTTNSQSSTDEVQSYVKYITDMQQLFIADVLLWKLLNGFHGHKFVYDQQSESCQCSSKYPSELNTSDMVKSLQKSSVEHLTRFRQLEARDFGSVATIVTTDFEALYAYKRGDYQQCLHLSAQSIEPLLSGPVAANTLLPRIFVLPEFIQLLDDDIVSLTALTLLANPGCRNDSLNYYSISQLTLLLYLMTQCQLKLRVPATEMPLTLAYIKAVRDTVHPVDRTLDRLILKMIAFKAVKYMYLYCQH